MNEECWNNIWSRPRLRYTERRQCCQLRRRHSCVCKGAQPRPCRHARLSTHTYKYTKPTHVCVHVHTHASAHLKQCPHGHDFRHVFTYRYVCPHVCTHTCTDSYTQTQSLPHLQAQAKDFWFCTGLSPREAQGSPVFCTQTPSQGSQAWSSV